jgi:hypothetical protein
MLGSKGIQNFERILACSLGELLCSQEGMSKLAGHENHGTVNSNHTELGDMDQQGQQFGEFLLGQIFNEIVIVELQNIFKIFLLSSTTQRTKGSPT